MNTAALITSIVSSIVASISCILSIVFFSKNRKASFFNLVYECLKPLSVYIYDALLIKDTKKYRDTVDIDKAEEKMYANFESLYSYGVGYNLPYLKQFSTLRIDDQKYELMANSMSFLFILSRYQDEYIKYRRNHTSGILNDGDNEELQSFVNIFRWLLEIQSKFVLSVLYKRKPSSKLLKEYYGKLYSVFRNDDRLIIDEQERRFKNEYRKTKEYYYTWRMINNGH